MYSKMQATIQQEVSFEGKTLFSGEMVSVRLIPAPENTGIIFRRTDLEDSPSIHARTEQVTHAPRTTKIAHPHRIDCTVQTIEHAMAAFFACQITNLIVAVNGPEMPIFDGSSLPFTEKIVKAGLVEQNKARIQYELTNPCYVTFQDTQLIALPANEFRVTYLLHYPENALLQSQYFSSAITSQSFQEEVAPARTFALYEEVLSLMKKGILKNNGLEHGIVIDGSKVLNADGVRFPNEMVRHKVLDMVGDISLLGWALNVHLIGIKTGHTANHAMAKQLRNLLKEQS